MGCPARGRSWCCQYKPAILLAWVFLEFSSSSLSDLYCSTSRCGGTRADNSETMVLSYVLLSRGVRLALAPAYGALPSKGVERGVHTHYRGSPGRPINAFAAIQGWWHSRDHCWRSLQRIITCGLLLGSLLIPAFGLRNGRSLTLASAWHHLLWSSAAMRNALAISFFAGVLSIPHAGCTVDLATDAGHGGMGPSTRPVLFAGVNPFAPMPCPTTSRCGQNRA
jgi:hypothetical protein